MSDRMTILQGDALETLKTLPSESVHCCVTSPPYWGLRDYGVEGQLGLEKTPEEYVSKMVSVFDEVRRVLRDDGTLWLNLGDTFWGGKGTNGTSKALGSAEERGYSQPRGTIVTEMRPQDARHDVLKPKDLVGIPWRLAFALQAEGWYLRSDIIWHKPNPMPESVTDRPTKSHEYVFLLAKSQKYFYDAEAIKEPGVIPEGTLAAKGSVDRFNTPGVNSRPPEYKEYSGTRNKRTVWTVTTEPYSEAHFATFPTDLVKPCILAGTSAKGCCPTCGAPWERQVEHKPMVIDRSERTHDLGQTRSSGTMLEPSESKTTGWEPGCDCGYGKLQPCTVLDPFAGSFTTCQVAIELGRRAIGIELNPKYIELGRKRCNVTPGLPLA